jgi:hypothetical protein
MLHQGLGELTRSIVASAVGVKNRINGESVIAGGHFDGGLDQQTDLRIVWVGGVGRAGAPGRPAPGSHSSSLTKL